MRKAPVSLKPDEPGKIGTQKRTQHNKTNAPDDGPAGLTEGVRVRFLRTQQCVKSQCMMHNPVHPTRWVGDGFLWLIHPPCFLRHLRRTDDGWVLSAGVNFFRHCLESLILAQDERWRRA